MGKTIFVLGLSGVGKSWLCSRFAARTGAVHVSASALLRTAKAALTGQGDTAEQLRTGQVLDNQQLLVAAFKQMRAAETRLVLLDGHNVVDDGRALVRIPLTVFRDIAPNGIVFVTSDPDLILQRRRGDGDRVRPLRSVEMISEHQAAARAAAEADAAALGLPVLVVEAGDEPAFARAIAAVAAH